MTRGWILNPTLDLLFCCGGMMWLAAILQWFNMDPSKNDTGSQLVAALLLWGAVLFNEPHGKATWVRVFASPSTPPVVKWIVVAWAVVLGGVSAYALQHPDFVPILVKITLCWLLQHYVAQTYGVAMIYCLKNDYQMSGTQKLILQNMLRLLTIFVITRMFYSPAYGALDFLGLKLPLMGPIPAYFVWGSCTLLIIFVILFLISVIQQAVLTKKIFPPQALFMILSLAALLSFERTTPFFVLGVSFYHGSQYLAITYSYYLKESAQKEGRKLEPHQVLNEFLTFRSIVYYAFIISLGFVTGLIFPQGMVRLGFSEAVVIGTFYSVFNCHHFLADALLWRIRNPKVRELLV